MFWKTILIGIMCLFAEKCNFYETSAFINKHDELFESGGSRLPLSDSDSYHESNDGHRSIEKEEGFVARGEPLQKMLNTDPTLDEEFGSLNEEQMDYDQYEVLDNGVTAYVVNNVNDSLNFSSYVIPENVNFVKAIHKRTAERGITFESFDASCFSMVNTNPDAYAHNPDANRVYGPNSVGVDPKEGSHIQTARIVITYNMPGSSQTLRFAGTAFLMGPYQAVTSAHCVFGDVTDDGIYNPRFANKIEFYFGINEGEEASADYEYYAQGQASYIEVDYALKENNRSKDWALVELDRAIGYEIGWYGKISNLTDTNTDVFSYGYPGGGIGVRKTMMEYYGKIVNGASTNDYCNCYNFENVAHGQSGSPVFWQDDQGNKYVCGVLSGAAADFCCGPYFTTFIFNFLNRYFTFQNGSYSYPPLHFQKIADNGTNYKIKISNGSPWTRVVAYNSKMCFSADGRNWRNLANIQYISLNPYSSQDVLISKNWFADAIAASYVYQGKRCITYANSVQNYQPSENYNIINA